MAIQFPAQFNALSLPAVDQAVQQKEYNALRNDALAQGADRAQTEWDDSRKQQAQQRLYQMASKSKQIMEQNPNAWAQLLPEWMQGLNEMGLPTDKIPPAGSAPESVMEGLNNILQSADMQGGNPQQPLSKADLIPVQGQDGAVYATAQDALGQGVPQSGITGDPSSVREFEHLSQVAAETDLNGNPTDRAKQAQIRLGTMPRAGMSADERIAGDRDLRNRVIDYKADEAETVEFAKKTGVARARDIDAAVEILQKTQANNRTLDKAIEALDNGAQSGPVVSRFTPTVRAATIELEQLKNQLGLDVVGAVTFGALSKGELDLALDTAMPNLPPEELKDWLLRKKTANEKLMTYYQEQIDFLDDGGTAAQFLRFKQRGAQGNDGGDFAAKWAAAKSGDILQAPDGTMRKKP